MTVGTGGEEDDSPLAIFFHQLKRQIKIYVFYFIKCKILQDFLWIFLAFPAFAEGKQTSSGTHSMNENRKWVT